MHRSAAILFAASVACTQTGEPEPEHPDPPEVGVHSCDGPVERIESSAIDLAAFPDPLFPSGGNFLAGLELVGIDYVELRFHWFDTDGPVPPAPDQTYASAGLACGGATDRTACLAELASPAGVTAGWSSTTGGHCTDYGTVVLATAGDQVVVVGTDRELMDLLGAIDNPAKAALTAALHAGFPDDDTTRIRELGDGSFEIVFEVRLACGPGREYHDVLRISPDGDLGIVARGLEFGAPVDTCPE